MSNEWKRDENGKWVRALQPVDYGTQSQQLAYYLPNADHELIRTVGQGNRSKGLRTIIAFYRAANPPAE